jgi:hypothetical protein
MVRSHPNEPRATRPKSTAGNQDQERRTPPKIEQSCRENPEQIWPQVLGAKTKFLWWNLKMTEANEQKTAMKIKNSGWENRADDAALLARENGQQTPWSAPEASRRTEKTTDSQARAGAAATGAERKSCEDKGQQRNQNLHSLLTRRRLQLRSGVRKITTKT